MHIFMLFGCVTLILVAPTQALSLSKATITELLNQAFLRRVPAAPRFVKVFFPNFKGENFLNLAPKPTKVSFNFKGNIWITLMIVTIGPQLDAIA